MDVLLNVVEVVLDAASLFFNLFLIVAGVLWFFNDRVRKGWRDFVEAVFDAVMNLLHVHLYRDKDGWTPWNWGGIECYQRTRQCRCGATKVKIVGSLPTA